MEQNLDPRALYSISYGLYIIGTEWEGALNGQIANTAMQLSSSPVSVSVCLHKDNLTTELMRKSRKFSVSVLAEDVDMPFIGIFGFRSGRDHDKYAKVPYEMGSLGLPLVTKHVVADLEAQVTEIVDVSTHELFIGTVKSARTLTSATPLTYAAYHTLKKGKSPANAPTVIFNSIK
ncbi:MAG: flavin reductase [Fretibacterium sp.]|nr:flavin reductase [Fretibacterium sp.]